MPAPPARRSVRLRGPALTIGGLAAATLALHLRDPHTSGSWGYCPSAALGVWCPGCGGLRAVNDLTDGQVGAALSSNLVVTLLIVPVSVLLALWAVRAWRGDARPVLRSVPAPVYWALGVSVLAFTILRNLPAGSWLAP